MTRSTRSAFRDFSLSRDECRNILTWRTKANKEFLIKKQWKEHNDGDINMTWKIGHCLSHNLKQIAPGRIKKTQCGPIFSLTALSSSCYSFWPVPYPSHPTLINREVNLCYADAAVASLVLHQVDSSKLALWMILPKWRTVSYLRSTWTIADQKWQGVFGVLSRSMGCVLPPRRRRGWMLCHFLRAALAMNPSVSNELMCRREIPWTWICGLRVYVDWHETRSKFVQYCVLYCS